MVELQILGSVRLRASDGREVEVLARHAKRTALLAYLAAAAPRGFQRRDTLLAIFWPESDTVRARAALNQALYVLRTSLGEDAIVSRGDDDVGLNGDVIWCDASAFETALDAGRPEDALALYRGDLLEGFFVSDAPEFERWLDRERGRLRERASQGAWALAEANAGTGQAVEAGRWARRAAEFLPADESVARRLMTFLAGLGDRAGAIRAYEAFAARLTREYDLAPSAETRSLAEAIRQAEPQRPRALAAQVPAAATLLAAAGAAPAAGHGRPERAQPTGWWRRAVALTLAGGVLAGGWLVFRASRGARSADPAAQVKRLTVLPFANLGRSEDEYFADGMTDEIAARLAAIDGLRVIGRTSGERYKQTEKTLSQIGHELGVAYVLEGSVRWERSPQGQARVRVTPQLVSVADGAQLWAHVYDEPLDEIFRVQSEIAQGVVEALDITLLQPQRRAMQAVPTRNLEAYDYYLRGEEYKHRGGAERLQRASAQMFEQAVRLDPGYAVAYAELARAYTRMYLMYFDHSPGRLAQAKWALDRAFALQPDLPEAHQSLGTYDWVAAKDYQGALREYAITEASRPNDPELFFARGVMRSRQGDLPGALRDLAKARELEPGSAWIVSNYGEACDFDRDFGQAEALYDTAIALSPDWYGPYFQKAGLYLRRDGSPQEARAVLDAARTAGMTDEPLLILALVSVDVFERRYADALERLSSRAPDVIEDQLRFIPRAQLYAEVYGLMGRRGPERAYYDSARALVAARLRAHPDDPRLHSALAIAYAGLGSAADAVREGRQATTLLPVSSDAYQGYYRAWDLARVYAMAGANDDAVDLLEHLLSIPGHLTAAWLRIDPEWDPLRPLPRFQSLVKRRG